MHLDLGLMLSQYGYGAILLGALLKGESTLLLGGYAARQGYLKFAGVAAIAALGGFLGDQLYFSLGRYAGVFLHRRFPAVGVKIRRTDQWILRIPALSVIGVRFLYGFRIVGPIAIGMTTMSWLRFALLNGIGAVLRAVLITALGYPFGHAVQALTMHAAAYGSFIVLFGLLVALAAWCFHRW